MAALSGPSNLRRLLALPAGERWLLIEAWWTLIGAAARLRSAPRRTVARALAENCESAGTSQGSAPPRAESAGTLQAVARAVARAAAHHLWPMTCLPRSIALQAMLARRDIPSSLRIGVRRDGSASGSIAAHAWVEVEGRAVGEPEAIEERFRPLLPPLTEPSSVRCEEHDDTRR